MSAKTSSELKALQSRYNKLKPQVDQALEQARSAQQEHSHLKSQLDSIEREIEQLKKQPEQARVSEHALLRYCQRVLGVDTEAIEQSIIDSLNERVLFTKTGKIDYQGVTYVVRDYTVVSVET